MSKDKIVWVLGRYGPGDPTTDPESARWEVQGIFATKAEAEAAAQPGEFFGPIEFGERLSDERVDWPLMEFAS